MATDIADWDYKTGQEWIAGYETMPEIRGKTARPAECAVEGDRAHGECDCRDELRGFGADAGERQRNPDQRCRTWRRAESVAECGGAARRERAEVESASASRSRTRLEVMDAFRNSLNARTRVLAIFASDHRQRRHSASEADVRRGSRARHLHGDRRGAGGRSHQSGLTGIWAATRMSAAFHKWLLAPAGAGFLYLRGERAHERCGPRCASSHWNDREDDGFRFTQHGARPCPC